MILWFQGSSYHAVHIHSRLCHCRRHPENQELLQPDFTERSIRLHLHTALSFHRSEKGELAYTPLMRLHCVPKKEATELLAITS